LVDNTATATGVDPSGTPVSHHNGRPTNSSDLARSKGPIHSSSWTPVAISGGDAAFAEFGQHGGVVDAEVLADSCEGPAEIVEVDGVDDLVGGEAAPAHRYLVAVEDVADRVPLEKSSLLVKRHVCAR
jgi:hypothetical protein